VRCRLLAIRFIALVLSKTWALRPKEMAVRLALAESQEGQAELKKHVLHSKPWRRRD